MRDLETHIDELRHLYVDKGWGLTRIGDHFGVSHQAVRYQLKKAKVELRKAGGRAAVIDPNIAVDLYISKRLSSHDVAAKLATSFARVRNTLEQEGIAIRERGRPADKYSDLRSMKIGESVLVPRPQCKGIWQGRFYAMAKKAGIRISVRTVDDANIRITRVG